MTQLEFETEKEKWIKRGEIKTYNMTELLTHDEGQTENHLAGAEVCAYAAYTSRLHVMLYMVQTVWNILGNTAQKSRRDTARSDIIRPWINR